MIGERLGLSIGALLSVSGRRLMPATPKASRDSNPDVATIGPGTAGDDGEQESQVEVAEDEGWYDEEQESQQDEASEDDPQDEAAEHDGGYDEGQDEASEESSPDDKHDALGDHVSHDGEESEEVESEKVEEVVESKAMPPLPKLARTAWRRWPVTAPKASPPPHLLAGAKVGPVTPPKVPQPRPKWHQDPKSLRFLVRVCYRSR